MEGQPNTGAAWLRRAGRVGKGLEAVLGALVVLAGLLMLMAADGAQASTVRAFTARFNTNVNGDIKLIGNTSMTCQTAVANCVAARAGGNFNNNDFAMVYDNTAGDATTFNATSSSLNIPSGSTVLYAALYWGGNSSSTQRGTVLFKTPTASGYTVINASQLDTANTGQDAQFNNNYSAFADVTSLVKAGGIGYYTVANVISDPQNQTWGGWGLVVAYQDNAQPLRNLVIYDGYSVINAASGAVNLTPNGFLTPLTGPIVTRVGSLGWDGDLNSTGDYIQVNGTRLVDALNNNNNYFNSSLSDLGVLATTNNPSYANQLGVDVDRSNVPAGVIANGATSATITATSTGETYYLAVVTFSTDIYVPIITPNLTKTVTDVNGGYLLPGDVLRWTIGMNNTGQDGGTKLTLTDAIPANNTYVPGSLRIVSGANAGVKTDGAGDDQAEKTGTLTDASPVIFRLGTGATATAGGTLAPGEATSLTFDTVVGVVSAGTQVTNTASISYSGQTLQQTTFSSSSSASSLTVMGPPVISKSFTPAFISAGGTAQLKIIVSNPSANPSTINGASFNDTYPAGMTNAATPNAQVVCTAGATAGTLTGGTAGSNSIGMNPGANLPPNASCTITVNVTAGTGSYTNSTGPVTSSNSGTGSAASATLSAGKIAIVKSFNATQINAGTGAGGPFSTLSLTLTNLTAATANGITFADNFPNNLQIATTPTLTNTCGGTVTPSAAATNPGTLTASGISLASGASCTITVRVQSAVGGIYNNTTGGATYTGDATPGSPSNTASLTVVAAPTITKSFNPTLVGAGGISTLSLVIANPNSSVTVTRAGAAAVLDNYDTPTNTTLVNANPSNAAVNCTQGSTAVLTTGTGAAAGTTLGISNLSLLPGGSCTVTASVSETATSANVVQAANVTYDNAPSAGSNTATLTFSNVAVPTATKTFTPATITAGGTSTLNIQVKNNSTTTALTGVSFTDNYPLNLFNSATPNPLLVSGCTGGTLTAAAGGSSFAMSGVTIAASATCSVTVQVTSSAPGDLSNATGPISSTNAQAGLSASGTLTVLAPPTITKSFATNPVGTSTDSVLTIVLSNPSNGVNLTGVTFTDTYPAGLVNGPTPNRAITCTAGSTAGTLTGGAAGGNTIGMTPGATIAPAGTCTITVNVRSAAAGSYLNTTGAPASTNGGTGTAASATLVVGGLGVTKSFTPTAIAAGGTSTITFQINNRTGAQVTGLQFTDTLSNMQLAGPALGGTCTGVVSNATAGATSLAITAGTVPAAGCTITVVVTSSSPGVWPNTTSGVRYTGDGGTAGPPSNTANLTVTPPPSVTKSFSPTQISTWNSPAAQTLGSNMATLTFTFFNTNAANATNASFTDTYPTGLVNAAVPTITNGCSGGTVTAAAGSNTLTYTGGTLPQNSACAITVRVVSSTPGNYVNTVPAGALATSLGQNTDPSSATLSVLQPVTPTKSFSPGSIASGGTALLTISLVNPNSTVVTGGAFVDTYPAGLTNASPSNVATSCASGSATTPATNQLQLTGATIPANGSCTVSVNVTGADGSYVNTLAAGAVTTGNAGASTQATSDNLQIGRARIDKAFSPNPILPGAVTTLTFTITNPTGAALGTVQFTDNLPTAPGAMVVANPPSAVNNCGGTFTAVAAAASVSLTGGSVPANGSCTLSVRVTAPTSGTTANPTYNNVTTGFSAGGTAGTNASATLTVMAGPTVTKGFVPASVGVNQASLLTITLTNPNNFAITGAAFTDTYPAGLINSASPGGSTTCSSGAVTATAGDNKVSLAGASIPANGSCTVSVNATSTTAGTYNNSLAANTITSTNAPAGTGANATASLTVLNLPAVAKSFATGSIAPGATVVMTISLTNPNSVPITGAALTDNYPAGLVNAAAPAASTTCTGGTVAATAGGTSVSLIAGTIPAAGSCNVLVTVTAATAGNYANNTGPVTTANAGTGVSASASLQVNAPLVVNKSFNATAVGAAGTASTLTITLTNPNPIAITGVNFVDAYPANMRNANTSTNNSCGGTVTASAAGTIPGTLTLTGGTVPANGSCSFTAQATGNAVGTFVNCAPTAGNFSATNAAAPAQACATLQVGTVASAAPSITKSFSPANVNAGAISTLTLTITNNSTLAASALAVNDTYPAGLVNASPTNATNTCNGTLTAAAGGNSLNLSGGSIGAGPANCIITIQVVAAAAGIYNNTTGQVSATVNGGTRTGSTASASLVVNSAPSIAKAFAPATINAGGSSTITFTLTNPNSTAVSGASFTDTLSNMSIATGGATAGGTCAASPANSFAAGATSLTFANLTIPAAGNCTVTIPVTSNVPGTWLNAASGVTAGSATGAPSNTASLQVNGISPTITKSFAPATIASGGITTMTLTLSNPNGSALTGVSFTDGMTNMNLAPTLNLGGTCTGVTTTSAGGSSSFTVTGGTIPANASCTITVQVTSNTVGTWPNVTSGVSTTQTPTAGSQSNSASLTVLNNGAPVSGTVFNDANTNGTLDNGETWAAGTPVFVNIVSAGTVLQSVSVPAGAGTYSFSNIPVGNYTIVLTNSNVNTVAVAPSGWFFTGPTDGTITTAVGTTGLPGQNFGLRSGPRITGRVFRDTGTVPAGTAANNGVLDTNEAPANPQAGYSNPLGISGVTLTLSNCSGTTYATTTTDGSGNYSFGMPGSLSAGNPLCVTETNPNAYLSTGASVGATAVPSNSAAVVTVAGVDYSYCRTGSCSTPAAQVAPVDTLRFAYSAAATYAGLNFGDVPVNTFVADQAAQGVPGSTVNYAHTFTPGSVGSVVFSTSRVTTPAAPVWNEVIYRDSNCNAILDGTEGATVLGSTPVAVSPNDTTAGDPSGRRVCIIVREFIPAAAPLGAENKTTVTATFTYANANPALNAVLTVTDTTLVGSTTGGTGLRLRKEVCNVTTTAAPGCVPALTGANAGNGFFDNNAGKSGDELMYRIVYSNASSNNLGTLVINDTTPPFTVRSPTVAPAYVVTPTGLTNGTITGPAAGQAGALSWTFTGNLVPNAQGVVTFNAQIQ